MATEFNIVTLSVSSYNQVKADNYRLNMLLDSIFNEAMISEDHEHLIFNTRKVEDALKFCFPERHKKRIVTLKTLHSRYGTNVAPKDEEGGNTNE